MKTPEQWVEEMNWEKNFVEQKDFKTMQDWIKEIQQDALSRLNLEAICHWNPNQSKSSWSTACGVESAWISRFKTNHCPYCHRPIFVPAKKG